MELRAFTVLVIPFIIVIYLAFLLFLRPTRRVLVASLLGGLLMSILNLLTDLVAYSTHWWHYALADLTFHLPLPLYITPFLIYGSLVYLLIWRYWSGRSHWFALLLLIGVPLLGILKDVSGGLTATAYFTYDSSFGVVMTIVMWIVMFFGGYALFGYLAPPRTEEQSTAHQNADLHALSQEEHSS